MSANGRFCPVEDCRYNNGGYCGKNMAAIGVAPTAFYPPGYTNFMAPFGPAVGVLRNDTMAEGQPPMTDDWGLWHNCPHLKEMDRRK